MNIRDLIESLEAIADEHGDDVQVRLAHQPSWPFEYALHAVVATGNDGDDTGDDDEPADDDARPVAYLVEGEQLGYLPGAAAQAIGWGR